MGFMHRGTSLRGVLALAALIAALAVSACGDDDDGGGDAKAPSGDSAQAPDGGNANASDGGAGGGDGPGVGDGSPGDGNASKGDTEPVNLEVEKLTPTELQRLQGEAPKPPPYKGYGFDRGSKQDKSEMMGLFREMQREFYGGQFMAFCKKFGTGIYSLPDLESGDGEQRIKECAGVISRMAKRVASGDLEWPSHTVQWVRIYRDPGKPAYGGVTVQTRGSEVRVSFVEKKGRWVPDFGVPRDMKALNAT